MFNKPEDMTKLDKAINDLYERLNEVEESSPEYDIYTNQLKKLYEIKTSVNKDGNHIKADTLALIAGNLAGIFIITQHEHLNVITSKAFSLLLKLK